MQQITELYLYVEFATLLERLGLRSTGGEDAHGHGHEEEEHGHDHRRKRQADPPSSNSNQV